MPQLQQANQQLLQQEIKPEMRIDAKMETVEDSSSEDEDEDEGEGEGEGVGEGESAMVDEQEEAAESNAQL